jgi:hypothetical protein
VEKFPVKDTLRKIYHKLNPLLVPLENTIFNLWVHFFPNAFWQALDRALDRGLTYFERCQKWEIDPIIGFTVFVDETDEPRLAMKWKAFLVYRKEWKDPFLRILDPIYEAERDGANCPSTYVPPDRMQELMIMCVNADRLGLTESFLRELRELEDGGSYGTTHILVGCDLLKRFSSIPRDILDATIAETIEPIARAQRVSRMSDIFSERVVFLLWQGYDRYVKPSWIVRIIQGQLWDGGWSWWKPSRRALSDQHPTFLSVAAMLLYRRRNHVGLWRGDK